MNIDAPFEELFAKRAGTIKPGLERMQRALAYIPKEWHNRPRVLVGGTNGKGTTAGFLWQLFGATGVRAALFTSPHLRSFCERFMMPEPVTVPEVEAALEGIQQLLPADVYDELSFFEIATLLFQRLAAKSLPDFDIMEVGLGGRWDSTNSFDPDAALIVSLGYDHQEYLGHDICGIAREKLGICRPGKPLFLGQQTYPEAAEAVERHCLHHGVPLFRFGHEIRLVADELAIELPGLDPLYEKIPTELAQSAPYLCHNFALARACHYWLSEKLPALKGSRGPISAAGALPPALRGRFEVVEQEFPNGRCRFLIDVCHNTDGVDALKSALTTCLPAGAPFPGLVCILGDKDINAMLDKLKSFINPLMLFKVLHPRVFIQEQLAERHRNLICFDSFAEAVDKLTAPPGLEELALDHGVNGAAKPVVVCGSVMAIGQVLELFAEPKTTFAT